VGTVTAIVTAIVRSCLMQTATANVTAIVRSCLMQTANGTHSFWEAYCLEFFCFDLWVKSKKSENIASSQKFFDSRKFEFFCFDLCVKKI